jgi:hypothetical protein
MLLLNSYKTSHFPLIPTGWNQPTTIQKKSIYYFGSCKVARAVSSRLGGKPSGTSQPLLCLPVPWNYPAVKTVLQSQLGTGESAGKDLKIVLLSAYSMQYSGSQLIMAVPYLGWFTTFSYTCSNPTNLTQTIHNIHQLTTTIKQHLQLFPPAITIKQPHSHSMPT